MTHHAGGCLCGTVRFAVHGEFERFFLCHCTRCRKDSGSAHGANLFSGSATLVWLSGEEHVTHYQLPDTRHTHSFCQRCGSALPVVMGGGAMLKVPAGALDTPVTLRPQAHLFNASRADWDHGLEEIPVLEGLPPRSG